MIELISIGDEILLGQTLDSNANWIADKLSGQGMRLRWISVIGDNPSDIRHALKRAVDRSKVILITGGLGPTHDDITRPALASFFNDELAMRQDLLTGIQKRYADRNITPPSGHERLAEFPVNAEPIPNSHGTAPGIHYTHDDVNLFAMPGVPVEMQGMMEGYVLSEISTLLDSFFYFRVIKTFGKGETYLADLIGDEKDYTPVSLAYLPSVFHGVTIRLSIEGSVDERAVNLLDQTLELICAKIKPHVFSTKDITFEAFLIDKLQKMGKTVSFAESCTGGMLCDRFVSVPGSSDVFKQGFVTYSNAAKIESLQIDPMLIKDHGAVSQEVASAMASNARRISETDFALSVTGIAGPGGGTPEKPVGLVYIGIATADGTDVKRYVFNGDRNANRLRSTQAALNLLWKAISEVEVTVE